MSSYLAFRYVPTPGAAWAQGICPEIEQNEPGSTVGVSSADDIINALKSLLNFATSSKDIGLLLSGGMDSAILGALLPEGTKAFTIRFLADDAVDESDSASIYAKASHLAHRIVDVTWSDYEEHIDKLMRYKRSPLHAVEVGLHKAAQRASAEGLRYLVIGNGADSTFGGLDKLLSKDWTFDDFIQRYTFIQPSTALREPTDIQPIYEPYRCGNSIDVAGFLRVVHGSGVVQAFNNAIKSAGCAPIAPYESLRLTSPLDVQRIRKGESKYLIREVFSRLYPQFVIPNKIPFARPMDQWLKSWRGPLRGEFRTDIALDRFSGDQKWLLYCLNRFLDLLDRENQ